MDMAAVKVTADTFEQEVLKSEVPVLVDFWAPWCGPCKMLSPVVEQLADEADGFKVASVNADDEMDLAEQFGISAIPCLVVFENGQEVRRSTGVIPKEQILNLIRG
jgi:thioredoxin 1